LVQKPTTRRGASTDLLADLRSGNPHQQLRACERLAQSRSVDGTAKDALFQLLNGPLDPALEHAAMNALIRHRWSALGELHKGPKNPDYIRRLLIIAENNPADASGNDINKRVATDNMDSEDAALARTALGVVTRLPGADEWAGPVLGKWLNASTVSPARLAALEGFCSSLLAKPKAQELVRQMLTHASSPIQQAALRVLASQTSGIANDSWLPPLEKALAGAKPGDLPLLLDAVKKLKSDRFNAKLQAIAGDEKQPLPLRLKALDSMKGMKLTPQTYTLLHQVLTGSTASSAARIQASGMLAAASLDNSQVTDLAPLLATVGPVELKEFMPFLRKTKDEALLRTLATELAKNPAIASQQESAYRTAFADKPTEIFEGIVLPALRKANEATEAKKLLLPVLAQKVAELGCEEDGRKHFEAGKGTCIACHKIGNAGRAIGPDLSKIGAIRTERDLLESILFPSNTLARDYEAHVIETSDGQSCLGVIKSHTAEGLLVVDVAGQEKIVPHSNIVADTTLTTSLMPLGLDGTMSEQDLCDLVSWLRSLR
jgi:putative heme-binding domain-containing protein